MSAKSVRICCLALLLSWPAPLRADAWQLLKKPDGWFQSSEGRKALLCVLSWQTPHGDWPKNPDTTREPYSGEREKLKGTFDNGATTGELRLLARAIEVTHEVALRNAFVRGFDHILRAQYPNGCWPQCYPLTKTYHRHVTFNDGSLIRLMEFLRDTREWGFLDPSSRCRAEVAFDRGVASILDCQIVIDGKKTVWGAQHDEVTLAPAKAWAYELPTLSGAESAGILRLLMSLESPSEPVRQAIEGGVAWFESAKLTGLRFMEDRKDSRLIEDSSAPTIWARVYDLKSGRPAFCDRDGVMKFSLAELGPERRNGYAWFGRWGEDVARGYSKWKQR